MEHKEPYINMGKTTPPQVHTEKVAAYYSEVPINQITLNPEQPRRYFDPQKLKELADSIKAQGVIQPVVVVPQEAAGSFRLVAGERRLRAAKKLQKTTRV